MNQTQVSKPTLTYRFFQWYGLLGAIPFIIFTIDTLLHPSEPHPITNSVALRLFQGLLVAPLTVGLGYLCVRRARGNIIGWLLIALGYGTSAEALRVDFGSNLFRSVVGSLGVVYFWITNLLIPCYFPTGRLLPPKFERWGNVLTFLAALLPIIRFWIAKIGRGIE